MWETDIHTYTQTDIQTDGTNSSIVAHFVRGNYNYKHREDQAVVYLTSKVVATIIMCLPWQRVAGPHK